MVSLIEMAFHETEGRGRGGGLVDYMTRLRARQRHLRPAGSARPTALLLAFAGCALILAAAACDKLPLLAPTQSTIRLFANATVVQANGTTDIIATVLEQAGTPVQNGTVVSFTTTLGSIDPQEARTNNGKATVRFIAGAQSGQAQIGAVSGGAAVTAPVTILVGGAAAARIQLTASPARLAATGGTSQISAVVTDANGNPLSSVSITFTSDAGTLSIASATTSSSGEARTTLNTNRDATVTATAGGSSSGGTGGTATAAVSGTVKVTVNTVASITLTPPSTPPGAGQSATFSVAVATATGASSFQTVTIDFGDGGSQSLGSLAGTTSVSHVYQSAGTYLVTVTGVDSTGDRTAVTGNITVTERPPLTMTIVPNPTSTNAGTPVSFAITVAAPPAGINLRDLTVDFGDGSSLNIGPVLSTTVSHAYCCVGTYTAVARATDSTGRTTSVSASVAVGERAPIAMTFVPSVTSTTAGTAISFTTTITTTSLPTGASLRDVTVDFGDGSSQSLGPQATSTVSHAYCCAAVFTAVATASDTAGQRTSVSANITVSARPPIAMTFVASPTNATAGAAITFTVTIATTSLPPGVSLRDVTVDFGDTSPVVSLGPQATATVSHAYCCPSTSTTYTAVATASDTASQRTSLSTQVVVLPRGPVPVTLSSSPAAGVGVRNFTFTAGGIPASTVVIRYDWDFGDGTTATTSNSTTSHVYPLAPSVYTVRVTVTTNDGNTGTAQIQLQTS